MSGNTHGFLQEKGDPEEPVSGSRVRRVVGEPSEVRRPIFIVGCHRSGTTMLRELLKLRPHQLGQGRHLAVLAVEARHRSVAH